MRDIIQYSFLFAQKKRIFRKECFLNKIKDYEKANDYFGLFELPQLH